MWGWIAVYINILVSILYDYTDCDSKRHPWRMWHCTKPEQRGAVEWLQRNKDKIPRWHFSAIISVKVRINRPMLSQRRMNVWKAKYKKKSCNVFCWTFKTWFMSRRLAILASPLVIYGPTVFGKIFMALLVYTWKRTAKIRLLTVIYLR